MLTWPPDIHEVARRKRKQVQTFISPRTEFVRSTHVATGIINPWISLASARARPADRLDKFEQDPFGLAEN